MALIDDVRDIVNMAHAKAWEKTLASGISAAPDEPGIISQLVGVDVRNALTQAWQNHSAGTGTQVLLSGTFIHQKPYIKTNGNRFEMGDLLLVSIHHGAAGRTVPTGYATLFQAKKSSQRKTGPLTGINEANQLNFYKAFTPFEIQSNVMSPLSPSTMQLWDIGDAPDCGCYLIAYDGHAYDLPISPPQLPRLWEPTLGPGHATFVPGFAGNNSATLAPTMTISDVNASTCTASVGVACVDELACFIADMLAPSGPVPRGRPFTPNASATGNSSDWDLLMKEFLNMRTSMYSHKRTGVGKSAGNRYRDLIFYSGQQGYDTLVNDANERWWELVAPIWPHFVAMKRKSSPVWLIHDQLLGPFDGRQAKREERDLINVLYGAFDRGNWRLDGEEHIPPTEEESGEDRGGMGILISHHFETPKN
jgi:hypothetical protein